jgi:hypothetical protein
VAIAASAVLGRAVLLEDTLLLPGRVVITLPPDDLRLLADPSALNAVTRSLRRAVRGGVTECLERLGRSGTDGSVVVRGVDDLRVTLVEGSLREADAWFEVRPAARADAQAYPPPGTDRA